MSTNANETKIGTRTDGMDPRPTSDDGMLPAPPAEWEAPPDLPPVLDLGIGDDGAGDGRKTSDGGVGEEPPQGVVDAAAVESGVTAAPIKTGATICAAANRTHFPVSSAEGRRWTDLMTRWRAGIFRDILPARPSWGFAVQDDVLVRRRGTGWVAVAVPATAERPRYFLYDVAAYRRSLRDRLEIESLGCFPVLPVELVRILNAMGRSDVAPKGVDAGDDEVLELVRCWLLAAVRGEPLFAMARFRRDLVKARGPKVVIESKSARGVAATTIAELAADGQRIHLVGHLGRSPARNMVKDAVWVAVSRARGLRQLPEGFGLVRSGPVGGAGMQPTQEVLRPVATPASLLRGKGL